MMNLAYANRYRWPDSIFHSPDIGSEDLNLVNKSFLLSDRSAQIPSETPFRSHKIFSSAPLPSPPSPPVSKSTLSSVPTSFKDVLLRPKLSSYPVTMTVYLDKFASLDREEKPFMSSNGT
ncbi:hypothetical protein GYMLUDRAFT_878675 [Collybiopsis luxurians FD-317 M1]|uniref:Uncharacterized protein n=1 Tax=Collybiopsis luxurians FD-317 M1 TaxID=944289 RepID=A0A0D0CAY9_9AGAR|nr:hypothetical protein GYMLUDRAFT_878675 [Collybiopsis luxurians FD-317 M1]